MQLKNNYTVIAFFPDKSPKKWGYVHKIDGFVKFLDEKFSNWQYINVYDRRSTIYLKRIKKGEIPPTFI
jgi:hypothetical protein